MCRHIQHPQHSSIAKAGNKSNNQAFNTGKVDTNMSTAIGRRRCGHTSMHIFLEFSDGWCSVLQQQSVGNGQCQTSSSHMGMQQPLSLPENRVTSHWGNPW